MALKKKSEQSEVLEGQTVMVFCQITGHKPELSVNMPV